MSRKLNNFIHLFTIAKKFTWYTAFAYFFSLGSLFCITDLSEQADPSGLFFVRCSIFVVKNTTSKALIYVCEIHHNIRFIWLITLCCSQVESDIVQYATYNLISGTMMQCNLPLSPLDQLSDMPVYQWFVSISNDNILYGTGVPFTAYDSKCLNCTSNESLLCPLKVCIFQILST